MFFRTTKKTAQDVSMNEPIDTDRDGNALTLMDTMASEDNMVENIDNKIKIEKLKSYMGGIITKRTIHYLLKIWFGTRQQTASTTGSCLCFGNFAFLCQ